MNPMVDAIRGTLSRRIDARRVEDAIRSAERRTSGEIRVSIAPFFWGSVERAAQRAFDRLGMRTTAQRNGVLIFIVPSRRRFVVLGDEGIHACAGQELWDRVRDALAARLRENDPTGGLVDAIATLGETLAVHFPYDAARDVDELPNAIDVASRDEH